METDNRIRYKQHCSKCNAKWCRHCFLSPLEEQIERDKEQLRQEITRHWREQKNHEA